MSAAILPWAGIAAVVVGVVLFVLAVHASGSLSSNIATGGPAARAAERPLALLVLGAVLGAGGLLLTFLRW
ncbi:MAG TPA: hypothetical protein VHF22_01250 [Planctomycetota bacterium]|nr:hypothetical protein [Planctomycetota bacterium]